MTITRDQVKAQERRRDQPRREPGEPKVRRAGRSAELDARSENFIPWEQMEPLLRPGMTFEALGDAVCVAIGLPPERYQLITRPHGVGEKVAVVIRDGCWLVPFPNDDIEMWQDHRETVIA